MSGKYRGQSTENSRQKTKDKLFTIICSLTPAFTVTAAAHGKANATQQIRETNVFHARMDALPIGINSDFLRRVGRGRGREWWACTSRSVHEKRAVVTPRQAQRPKARQEHGLFGPPYMLVRSPVKAHHSHSFWLHRPRKRSGGRRLRSST